MPGHPWSQPEHGAPESVHAQLAVDAGHGQQANGANGVVRSSESRRRAHTPAYAQATPPGASNPATSLGAWC